MILAPDLIMTFTMDRYVMDVMERTANRRGIDFLEMTTSIIPNQIMFMRRGRPVRLREPPDEEVDAVDALLCNGDFEPTYVRNAKRFSALQFWRVFGYFALRGAYFNFWRFFNRDPYNVHYLDAQKRLKHKARVGDVAVLSCSTTTGRLGLKRLPHSAAFSSGYSFFRKLRWIIGCVP